MRTFPVKYDSGPRLAGVDPLRVMLLMTYFEPSSPNQ